jgi:hypothetical protein
VDDPLQSGEAGQCGRHIGELGWAVQLWGAAEALRQTMDVPRLPVDRVGYEQAVGAARVHLGEEAFSPAWQEGWMTKLEQVIDEATHP